MDRRIKKTTDAIKKELLKQMQTKTYNELTVTGLCDALNISRRTFYLHFYSIDDLFTKLFDDINEPLYREFEEFKKTHQNEDNLQNDSEMLKEIFRLINGTISRNTEYLKRIACEPSYSGVQARHISLMKDMIGQYLNMSGMESDIRRIYLDYYIAGILELYFQWYRGDIDFTLDEIRSFALQIMENDMTHFIPAFKKDSSSD
jgi:AcrR family transcriptional regulator